MTEGDGTIQLPSVTHQDEIRSGERFDFGKNWTRFLSVVNDSHIAAAEGVFVREV